jgi:hypothetical protein
MLTEPSQQDIIFPYLPDEIWNKVFQFIYHPRDWIRCRAMCRQWHKAVDKAGFTQINAIGIETITENCTPESWPGSEETGIRERHNVQLPLLSEQARATPTFLGIQVKQHNRSFQVNKTLAGSLFALIFIWKKATKCSTLIIRSLDHSLTAEGKTQVVQDGSPFQYFLLLFQNLNQKFPREISNFCYQPFMISEFEMSGQLLIPWIRNVTAVEIFSCGSNFQQWAELLSYAIQLTDIAMHVGPMVPHVLHEGTTGLDFTSVGNFLGWRTNKKIRKLELHFCSHPTHFNYENIHGLAAVIAILPPRTVFALTLPSSTQYVQNSMTVQPTDWVHETMMGLWLLHRASPFNQVLTTLVLGYTSRQAKFSIAYQAAFPQLTQIHGFEFRPDLISQVYRTILHNVDQKVPVDLQIHCKPISINDVNYRGAMATVFTDQPKRGYGPDHLPMYGDFEIQMTQGQGQYSSVIISITNVPACTYRIWIPLKTDC